MLVTRERTIEAPIPIRKTIQQKARDLDLRLEREPKDPEQDALLYRILKGVKLLGRYWTVSGVLEIDGTERRLPDIGAALEEFAPAGLREAA